jgi:hypothetical protein
MSLRPNSREGKVRAALVELLHEHKRDGALPTSGRFLYYELIARGIVSKEKKGKRRPDQIVNDALTTLRESDVIPWDWVADETRSLEDFSGSPSIKQAVLDYLPAARLDPWQRETILVLTESRSLAGVLRSIAARYRVQIASTNGQCGGFLHTEIAPMLDEAFLNTEKLPRVLYLGDFDLCGNQIESNTRKVLEQEIGVSFEKNWERVALTARQVEQHNLRRFIKHDRRYKDERPHEAVETEALSQRLVIELLETKLVSLLPEPLERVHEREKRQQRAVRNKITTR